MAYLLAGTVLCLVVLAGARGVRASLYSPLTLNALVWTLVFAGGLLFGGQFYPLTGRAFAAWLTWFLASSLVYLLFAIRPRPEGRRHLRQVPLDYVPLLVILCGWLLYHIRSVGLTGPAHFFFNLRFDAAQNVGFTHLGLLDRLYPWVFALFGFEQVNAHPGNRGRRALLWVAMLLYALATMAKFGLLTPVLVWAIVKGLRGELPKRRLLLAAPVVLALMIAFQFARDVRGQAFSPGRILGVYSYSPLVAFGYMAPAPLDTPFGAHVFRLAYVVFDAVLGGVEPVGSLQPVIAVPFTTNVYTVMRPFWLDFGLPGVLFGAAVFGVVFGGLHHLARSDRQLPLLLYAGLATVLVGQFFDDLLFTMASGQLQFVAAACFLVAVSREITAER